MTNNVMGTYSYKNWIARLKELGLTCEEQSNPVLTVQRGQKWDRNELGTGTSYAVVSVYEERVLYAKKAGKFVAVYRDIDSGWIDPSIDTDDKS